MNNKYLKIHSEANKILKNNIQTLDSIQNGNNLQKTLFEEMNMQKVKENYLKIISSANNSQLT